MARMNDRGQILLIGAIAIAVTFLSLGIVLNGSLHTPALAAQASDDVTGGQFEGVQTTVNREIAGVMESARTDHPDNWPLQSSNVFDNVTAINDDLEQYYARKDVALSFGIPVPIEGRDTTASVDDDSSTSAPDSVSFSNTEARELIVTPTVSGSDDITIEITEFPTPPGPDPDHTITITPTAMIVDPAGTAGPGTCPYSGDIHLLNASQSDGQCPELEFINDLGGGYDISLTADGGSAQYDIIYRGNNPSIAESVETEIVYEVRVPITFDSPSMHYDGTIEVDPGEP